MKSQLFLGLILLTRAENLLRFSNAHAKAERGFREGSTLADGSIVQTVRKIPTSLDASSIFIDGENVVEVVVLSLPDFGDVSFTKTSDQSIGPYREASKYQSRFWSGTPNTSDMKLYSGDASFVLNADNELFCVIKMGKRRYQCAPCSQPSELKSCFNIVETSSIPDGFAPMKRKRVPKRDLSDNSARVTPVNRQLQTDDGTVIDIMVAYTAAVVEAFISEEVLQSAIITAVGQSNVVFSNNEIDLAIDVVALGEVAYVETGDIDLSLDFIESDLDVLSARDLYGADLVVFLTMDDTGVYAYNPNPVDQLDEDIGFSIIGSQYMLGISFVDYPFSLAFGYNIGLSTNFEDSNQDREIPYAYGYQSIYCGFHTIMSNACDDSEILPYYSTPLFYYTYENDILEYIGNAEVADCARVITDYKQIVSQFRDSVVDTPTVTSIPTVAPTATPTVTFTATPTATSALKVLL